MKNNIFLALCMTLAAVCDLYAQPGLPDYIDTRVGTSASITKTAGQFGKGTEEYAHTLPAVLVPNGMNFWTPQTRTTEKKGVCPYIYTDAQLQGFRCSHWIVGGCTQDYGSFTILPTTVDPRTVASIDELYVPLNHDDETASPDYYSVRMTAPKGGVIRTEMTATSRAAMLRISFPTPEAMYVVIVNNNGYEDGTICMDTLRRMVVGCNPIHRIYQGKGEPAGHAGHFVMQSDADIEEFGQLDANSMWVKLSSRGGSLTLRAANSFVSANNALMNMNAELANRTFDDVRTELAQIWERQLGRIIIETDNQTDKRKFYGAMYRASFLPHVVNDVDGSYPQFANGHNVMQVSGSHDYYDDYSMWDTYRALHPLLTIISPSKVADMMQSLVLKYEQGGWMPIFPCWNSYTAAMIGDHCSSVFADAYVKGIRSFDAQKAYEGLRQNAFTQPADYKDYCNGWGRRALDSYMKYGYIPLEDSVKEAYHTNEQTSRTLEYAYDDFALAQFASALGRTEDARQLMQRSMNYRNVFGKDGWVGGRHADGSFAKTTDLQYLKEPDKYPATQLTSYTFATFITEGVPAHYSWYVPHDVEGLIHMMGGRRQFEAKLDTMFASLFLDGSSIRDVYWHGNEPCHQIAYLYNYIGRNDKTRRAERHILETEYLDAPGGLSGNDDAGQMSAWYIFSSLGFYPVCPSKPYYDLGEPTFRSATIHLENGNTLTITNTHNARRRVLLNGKVLKDHRITHDQLMQGGCLQF